MAHAGITARILDGWTGHDHLITDGDRRRVHSAVHARPFESREAAEEAAYQAFVARCDRRVQSAKIVVDTVAIKHASHVEAKDAASKTEAARYWRV